MGVLKLRRPMPRTRQRMPLSDLLFDCNWLADSLHGTPDLRMGKTEKERVFSVLSAGLGQFRYAQVLEMPVDMEINSSISVALS